MVFSRPRSIIVAKEFVLIAQTGPDEAYGTAEGSSGVAEVQRGLQRSRDQRKEGFDQSWTC